MIDVVAGYARGYSEDQIRPFLKTLRGSGYEGRIILFADGGAAKEAQHWQVDLRECPRVSPGMLPHSDRFLQLYDALEGVDCEGILLADTRDVVFQKNVAHALPSEGLHVFEEDPCMTLGSCPYNSLWMTLGYGEWALEEMEDFPISCVGTTCGDPDSVLQYLQMLVHEISVIQPRTRKPQDQAAHNWLIRKVLSPRVWNNEEGEVYTVGYIPRESPPKIVAGKIINKAGMIPSVIHQWDRHQTLKTFVEVG